MDITRKTVEKSVGRMRNSVRSVNKSRAVVHLRTISNRSNSQYVASLLLTLHQP